MLPSLEFNLSELDPQTLEALKRGEFRPWGTVTEINLRGGVISAANAAGERLSLQIPGAPQPISSRVSFRLGQLVFAMGSGAGMSVTMTPFPIKAAREDTLGTSARRMSTSVTLADQGMLVASTRTWTSEALVGFTGGVIVFVTDIAGNPLWQSTMHRYGVNGTAIPGAPSDTTASWTETVPGYVLNQAAGVAIAHFNSPVDRLPDFLTNARATLNQLLPIIEIVLKIIIILSGGGGAGGGGTAPAQ